MSMTLLDWRRRVAAIYADVRETAEREPLAALERYRAARDVLFREHPDSPLPDGERVTFPGVPYWDHDPALRFEATVEPAERRPASATSLSGRTFDLERIGRLRLPIGDLEVYWIAVYGGGVFIPFRDGTSGPRRTAPGATSSTRSRAPTWAATAIGSSSTSTTPTTRRAPTTHGGSARSRRGRTGWRSDPLPASDSEADDGPGPSGLAP